MSCLKFFNPCLFCNFEKKMSEYCYKYPRPAVTSDIIVFGYDVDSLKVLLIERKNPPFQGMWALPGGFWDMEETVEECAKRELEEETSLKIDNLELFEVASKLGRDPRGRTVSAVFWAIIPLTQEIKAQDDAANIAWFDVKKLPELAFDHDEIMIRALIKLRLLANDDCPSKKIFVDEEIRLKIKSFF